MKKEKKTAGNPEESARRRLFAWYMARLGDPGEAAVQAGYPAATAHRDAALLLGEKRMRRRIARVARQQREQGAADLALAGLRRLAFAPVNDAVALALSDPENPPDLTALDLFAVSEIKRPKGGGWEIKFHNRLEALALLLKEGGAFDGEEESPLCKALMEGARNGRDNE